MPNVEGMIHLQNQFGSHHNKNRFRQGSSMDAKTSEQKFDYLQDIRTALIIAPENTYS